MRHKIWPLTLSFICAACHGEQSQIGVEEPFRVEDGPPGSPPAQFFKGKLPGTAPSKGPSNPVPAPASDGGGSDGGSQGPPHLVDFSIPNPTAFQGEGGIDMHGTATIDAYSVGLQLEGIGSGYWVVPVGDVDPAGGRVWSVSCEFSASVPPGNRTVLGVAFDENGNAGPQLAQKICIGNQVPDNLNSCPNSRGRAPAPPEAVIALTWDTNVDLDLEVLAPSGVLVDPKHPLLTELDATAAKKLASPTPHFDGINRDSNAGCAIDGIREEDLVFYNGKPHGTFQIFANLFAGCGQPAVRFRVEVWAQAALADGGVHLVRYYPRDVDPQGGELLDISANGGSARGLFVTEFTFH